MIQDNLGGNLGEDLPVQTPNLSRIPPVTLQGIPNTTLPEQVMTPGIVQQGDPQYSMQGATHPSLVNTQYRQQHAYQPRINLIPNYKPPQPVYLKPGDLPSFYFDPFPNEQDETLTDPVANTPAFFGYA